MIGSECKILVSENKKIISFEISNLKILFEINKIYRSCNIGRKGRKSTNTIERATTPRKKK